MSGLGIKYLRSVINAAIEGLYNAKDDCPVKFLVANSCCGPEFLVVAYLTIRRDQFLNSCDLVSQLLAFPHRHGVIV